MKKITFIADTHGKHNYLNTLLPGGDILICAGDITGRGYKYEIEAFLNWFDKLDHYDHKIFIAGNHDFGFQDHPEELRGILTGYKNVEYLEDELILVGDENYDDMIKIWGTPWQPRFHDWAFNLDRGEPLKEKWDMTPPDVDILITHGPPFGKLDFVRYVNENVGCEDLLNRVQEIKPKLHVFGHIHQGYGYVTNGETHFFNAAVVDEKYNVVHKPHTILWDKDTNHIEILE